MDVFWRRWGTQGTLKAPLEAVLERDADFRLFFGAFLEALGDPLAPLVLPGDPTPPLSSFFGPVGAILQPRGGIRGTTRKRLAFWLLEDVKK